MTIIVTFFIGCIVGAAFTATLFAIVISLINNNGEEKYEEDI
ncbi:secreted protein [gut metagenome]|uniref:Secreted protein n=1 Tax=gut metagenome TaxID=749906 RepID=J9FB33_9ZZZZ